MEHITKNLGAYNLHLIKTNNFKFIIIKVYFREKIKKENITMRNFLTNMLTFSTKIANTKRNMVLKMQDLYSCSITGRNTRLGNFLNTAFTLSVLKDKYTEEGNVEKAIKFLSDVIYNPNVKDNSFDEKSFNVIMNQSILALGSIKEDASSYSILRLYETMEEDSPLSYRACGYLEDLKKITREKLYKYYNKMIDTNDMDIFVVGDIDFETIDPLIRKYFKSKRFKKTNNNFVLEEKRPRRRYKIETEINESTQSKLALGCRTNKLTEYERKYPLTLYNIILGGSADSKLFINVREKNSLCYTISSVVNKLDNTLLIRAGINKEDLKKTLKLIEKELDNMKKGKFTETDIAKAKGMYITALDEIKESESDIIASFYMEELLGLDNIDTRIEKMKEVTKQDIMKVAKKVKLDTVFMLEGVIK